jgi:hypothetical protein
MPGAEAVAGWARLKEEGRGWPVIVGNDENLCGIAERLEMLPMDRPPLAQVLEAAHEIRHPDGLIAYNAEQTARAREFLSRSGFKPSWVVERAGLWVGTVLSHLTPTSSPDRLTKMPEAPVVCLELSTGAYLRLVHLLLIPTEDWTTVPAHLRWGGWNTCPPDQYHVAALRSWRDRFGAEMVAIGRDSIALRIARPPATGAEAIELAGELHAYCPDLVEQGAGTVRRLATRLLGQPWWHLWWD